MGRIANSEYFWTSLVILYLAGAWVGYSSSLYGRLYHILAICVAYCIAYMLED